MTNEPKLVAAGEGDPSENLTVGKYDEDEDEDDAEHRAFIDRENIRHRIANEKARKSLQTAIEEMRQMREEHVLDLNEEALREAENAMAVRRARLREQKKQKNAKPGNQTQGVPSRRKPLISATPGIK